MFGRASGIQWLVVCLGNPGPKYAGTRHNAGFLAADALSKNHNVSVTRLRFRALTGKWTLPNGDTALIMKPQTYMNNSGETVGAAARFFKIPADHVLVLSDDISLPCGKLRIRTKGSAGGHNGLKSIISHLGTEAFPRIKIGVGAPVSGGQEQIDWVLGVPRNQDAEAFAAACAAAAEAAEEYILHGPEKAMGKFN
ncbi:MAG: aminoacyl-tRNA hydrolase [Oscillospiraceae bacterium]